MPDRAQARIAIGGPVTKKNWKYVLRSIEDEFGEAVVNGWVDRREVKTLRGCTLADLQNAVDRYEEAANIHQSLVKGAWSSVPLKKLDRVVGAVVHLEAEEAVDGHFADLEQLLREIGLSYVTKNSGRSGSWPAQVICWNPYDPEREIPEYASFYNELGERVITCVDHKEGVPSMSASDIRAAYKIARKGLEGAELPPGPDLGDLIINRIIEIGTGIPSLPVITLLEE